MSKNDRSLSDTAVKWSFFALLAFAALYLFDQELDAFRLAASPAEYESQSQGFEAFGVIFQRHDTIAQWAMALLSLAAVYLLWKTLQASRETLLLTQELSRETTRIGEAQVRAYLSVNSVSWNIGYNQEGKIVALSIIPNIKNSGSSPAKVTAIWADISTSSDKVPNFSIPVKNAACDLVSGANETVVGQRCSFAIKEAFLSYSRSNRIFVLVWFRYRHIFQKKGEDDIEYHTCFEVIAEGDPAEFKDIVGVNNNMRLESSNCTIILEE